MKSLNIFLTNSFRSKLSLLWLIILSLFSVVFSGCKKDQIQASVTVAPVLSTSASSLVLNRANAAQPAVTFSWSAASVKGMDGSVSYFLEWDLKGNNFSNPTHIKVGRDSLSKSFTEAAFNNLMITLPTATASTIEIRVVSATSDGSVAPFYSNVIALTVTPYALAIPPPFNQLWLVGDATPNGWDLDHATSLVQDGTDPFIFTYTGNLSAGDFKIVTVKDWGAAFYRPVANYPEVTDNRVQLSAGDPDNKWKITRASKYQITLNLRDLTITIVDLNADLTPPPFSQLWMVGDASPKGWDLDNATPLLQDSADPFIFTYTGALTAGEFKVATIKSWDGQFYRPIVNHPALSDTGVKLSAGDPDNKWQITDAGNYKVRLDLRKVEISIIKI